MLVWMSLKLDFFAGKASLVDRTPCQAKEIVNTNGAGWPCMFVCNYVYFCVFVVGL